MANPLKELQWSSRYATFLFIGLLGLAFFFLSYQRVLFDGPQGLHFIRQSDSLSFALQYFNLNADFLEPHLFNLESLDGRAAGEFPLLYYLAALGFKLFGPKLYLLKIIHFALAYGGLICAYRIALHLLKDVYYSAAITLFLLTSTVYNYYALNYLPDAPALGLTFMGWYLFLSYKSKRKKHHLNWAFVLFTLASLIKVTYFINPLALLGYQMFAFLFGQKPKEPRILRMILLGFVAAVLVISWNAYAIVYNFNNQSDYFLTGARPIWQLADSEITLVWDYIQRYWFTKYFAQTSFHFLAALFLFQIFTIRKLNSALTGLTGMLLLGCISYFSLFFLMFRDHDYYFLVFMPLVFLVLINGIYNLRQFSSKWLQWGFKLVLGIVVLSGINYSKMKLQDRYEQSVDDISRTALTIRAELPELKKLEIPPNAKVILAPDRSVNGGLLYLNRMGWRFAYGEEMTRDSLLSLKAQGANYLLVDRTAPTPLQLGQELGESIYRSEQLEVFELE